MHDQYEEGSNSVVIAVIKDLTKRVEEYEKNSSSDRAEFKASIEASIVQLRKDFQRALTPFLMDSIDHKRIHEDDRRDAIAQQQKLLEYQNREALERTQRQAIVDRRFTILTIGLVVLVVLVVFLLIILIVRIARIIA